MQTPPAARHSLFAAYRPPAWAIERIIGTVVMVAAPLTARAPLPVGAWAAMVVGVVGWMVFLTVDRRWPRAALIVLGSSAMVTAQTIAVTGDGTGVIMVCVALAALATHTRPMPATIMVAAAAVLGSAALGQLVRGRPLTDLATDVSVVLIVVALGLVRLAHSLGSLAIQLEVADALLSERGEVDAALSRVRRARRLAIEGLAEARQRGSGTARRRTAPARGAVTACR